MKFAERGVWRLAAAVGVCAAAGIAQPVQAQRLKQFPSEPERARLVTSDIDRFWAILDKADDDNLAELLQREYIDMGSPGVKDFVPARIISGEALAKAIRERPERYSAEARERTQRIKDFERGIRASLFALKHLYPPAVFPDVYFVIGRLNSGGTSSSNGLLIGAEMYAGSDDKLNDLPAIVAHEWAHFQQSYPHLDTLLAKAIQEGSADFIARLVVQREDNQTLYEFGDAHEAEVWALFQQAMHAEMGADATKGWMYGGTVIPGGPNDLAYYMGSKICEEYYRRSPNKRRAIYDMLNVADFELFLERSGYARKFTESEVAEALARVQRMRDEVDAKRPRIVSISPANGATDVDPATSEIVIVFDRPMRAGYSLNPLGGGVEAPDFASFQYDETGTRFTMKVNLAPNRDYAFQLNWTGGGSFQSEEGAPLEPVEVRFSTGPG